LLPTEKFSVTATRGTAESRLSSTVIPDGSVNCSAVRANGSRAAVAAFPVAALAFGALLGGA
jgi:hypothetical protein